MKRYSIFLAAVALLAVIIATTTPAEAAFPGGNGYIVFNGNQIYRMNPDGTDVIQLTYYYDGGAAWSSDGTRIAFHSRRSPHAGDHEVYVMNADGTDQTRLTNSLGSDYYPEWSPDGSHIVFTSKRDGNDEIYVMNADGTDQTNLTNNSAYDATPSWSPDGTKIVFTSDRDGDNEIYVMDADGSNPTNLTKNSASDGIPDWSPDGTKIVFESQRDVYPGEIYVMNADGTGEPTRLTTNSHPDSMAVWSPDGTRIVFHSWPTYYADIYVMNADGTGEPTRLTTNPGHDYAPSWQPIPLVPENQPPVLDPIGNQIGSEGVLLEFVVTATDPDTGDILTFDATNLPEGATFNPGPGPNTATFSWTPDYDQAGQYTDVEFSVHDDGNPVEIALELISITIGDVNRAPEFTPIGAQSVDENEPLTFQVNCTDPDGDDFDLSVGELPSGADFSTNTGLFLWTPDYWMAGTYTVVFSATDNGDPNLTGDLEVVITVGDVDAPGQMTEEIIEIVTSLNLPQEVENSYMANLKKVPIFIEKNKVTPAINQLDAFISKVERDIQQGKIDAAVGDDLINKATGIMQQITP